MVDPKNHGFQYQNCLSWMIWGHPHDFGNLQVRHTRVLISPGQSAASRIDQHCQQKSKVGWLPPAICFSFLQQRHLDSTIGRQQLEASNPVSWRQCLKSVLCCHAHGFALTSAGHSRSAEVSTRHQPSPARHDGCPMLSRGPPRFECQELHDHWWWQEPRELGAVASDGFSDCR